MSDKKYEMAPGTGTKGTPRSDTDAQVTAATSAANAGPVKDTKGAGRFGMKVGLDHPNRELYVSTTRAVAGVSVASFCGLLIGVVALSRNASNNGPQGARASETPTYPSIIAPADRDFAPAKHTSAAPRAATPKPVQLVPSTPSKPAPLVTATPVKSPAPTTAPSVAVTPVATVAAPTTAPVAATTTAPEGRIIGQTYFVFGSYPKAAEAKRAAKRLEESGVTCTIEQNLPGWTRKGWYSVVSVKGFTSTKDAGYQKELKSLQAKELEPHGYTWRAVKA